MGKNQSTKLTYDTIADEFSASRAYIWPDIKPYLDQVQAGASVLDLGCGNGRILNGLPNDINYLGIDQSENLLEKAKLAHPNKNFLVADITEQKTWRNLLTYDFIFCIAVIHHLSTYHEHMFLLEQIKKHLNPGGKVLITAWNLWQPKLLKHHLDIKTKLTNHHHVFIPFQGHPRFHFAHTGPYLKKLVEKSHLDLVVEKTKRNYLIHS
ncbi:hypothetical protein A2572_03785 [Candidatus Collierbacteria bacterium RIFOXYD1_FULL_40_9]|uniref:Methyltransferase domain-containing protein n=1 Tax=Candidatus Collierbacteria bacterium RIFOXYD1_FULL_40_9 TaxID=1817731 RepID=A0A1F5FU75_9BACT|nr:MAG: hypothetical protein A2572_03785 [Candidatus Collierbacteria bacterium RIFOXYD1_FULL_40_9]